MAKAAPFTMPEFMYLDDQKVTMFTSMLEGGLAVQSTRSRKQVSKKSGGITLGLPMFPAFALGGGLESSSGEETMETRKENEYSRFVKLLSLLSQGDNITVIDNLDDQTHRSLKAGQFLAVTGETTVSPVETLLGKLAELVGQLPEVTQDVEDKDSFQLAMKWVLRGVKKGITIFIYTSEDWKYRFVSTLVPQGLKGSLTELPSRFTTFGRISRILGQNETVDLIAKFLGDLRLPQEERARLVKGFQLPEEEAGMFGVPTTIEDRDTMVRYPAIVLTPVAIYR